MSTNYAKYSGLGGGGGTSTSIGAFDGQPPSVNGLTILSGVLYAQSADATHPGMVNTTTQTFAGNKTFTGTISAANFSGSSSGTNTGDVTLGTANGLSLTAQVLSLGLSSTSTTGALSSTDWNTFNNKQSALTFGNLTDVGTDGITVTNGTGAVIGTGTSLSQHVADTTHNGYLSSTDWNTFNNKQSALTPGSISTASANFAVGSGANSTVGPNVTLTLTEGNLTEATSAVLTITGGTNSVLGSGTTIQVKQSNTTTSGYLSSTDWNTFNGKQAAGNYITALTGDATASGPGSAALTLATVNANVGSFGSSSAVPSFTVNAKGLITAASSSQLSLTTGVSGVLPIANGGTDNGSLAVTAGGTLYTDGTKIVNVGAGTTGQVLTSNGASAPTWATNSPTFSGLTTDGVIYATSSSAVASTAAGTTGFPLVSNGGGGSAPTFQQLSLTAGVSGVLPIANGGTDNGSLPVTAGGVLYTDGTQFQNTGAGTSTQYLSSNGASAPTWANLPVVGLNNYWSGYTVASATWTDNVGTAFVDGTNSGGNTVTTRQSSSITASTAAGTTAGITFTPATNTAVYYIIATTSVNAINSGGNTAVQLTDGTVIISTAQNQSAGAGTVYMPISIQGIYAPATTSAVTVKIQLQNVAGPSSSFGGPTSVVPSIEWTVLRLY